MVAVAGTEGWVVMVAIVIVIVVEPFFLMCWQLNSISIETVCPASGVLSTLILHFLPQQQTNNEQSTATAGLCWTQKRNARANNKYAPTNQRFARSENREQPQEEKIEGHHRYWSGVGGQQ